MSRQGTGSGHLFMAFGAGSYTDVPTGSSPLTPMGATASYDGRKPLPDFLSSASQPNTLQSFLTSVLTARRGAKLIYHRGFLANDSGKDEDVRRWAAIALLVSNTKMTHPLLGGTQVREFTGLGSFALTQFRHGEKDYTYVMGCIEPLKRVQITALRERCDRMNIQFGWGKYDY